MAKDTLPDTIFVMESSDLDDNDEKPYLSSWRSKEVAAQGEEDGTVVAEYKLVRRHVVKTSLVEVK